MEIQYYWGKRPSVSHLIKNYILFLLCGPARPENKELWFKQYFLSKTTVYITCTQFCSKWSTFSAHRSSSKGKILSESLQVNSVAVQQSCCHNFLFYASAFLVKVLHCPRASDHSVHFFSSTERKYQCFLCIHKNDFKHKGKFSLI